MVPSAVRLMRYLAIVVAMSAAPALAAPPSRVVITPFAAVGGNVPQRVLAKLEELFAAEVDRLGGVRISLPLGGETAPAGTADLAAQAWQTLAKAAALYENLKFDEAVRALESARGLLDPNLAVLDDVQVLVDTHVALGVTHVAREAAADAMREFAAALVLRPDLRLSLDRYPTRVVSAFDKARVQAEARSKAYLTISSSPGFAIVDIDGVTRGDTPLTLSLPAGRHRYWVRKEGYAPMRGLVDLSSGPSQTRVVTAKLEPDPVREARLALAGSIERAEPRKDAIGYALALADALDASHVLVGGARREADRFVLSVANVEREQRSVQAVTWGEIDTDLSQATGAVRALARRIWIGRNVVETGAPPIQRFDARVTLVGLLLPPAVDVRVTAAALPPASAPPPARRATRWWLWAGLGAAAAGGVVAALVLRPESSPEDTIILVVPDPNP